MYSDIVRDCETWVREGAPLPDAPCAAHDWWHIHRVRATAMHIQALEGGDPLVVELAALLHDVDDQKLVGGDGTPVRARTWLRSRDCPAATVDHICRIIKDLSFKGAGVPTPMDSLEGAIVQDADRLDAIGAIGIARAFSFGGSRGRPLFVPGMTMEQHQTEAAYRSAQSHTIAHFHEKLLLLADRMNTPTARAMAAGRHAFMEDFLGRFSREWEGGL